MIPWQNKKKIFEKPPVILTMRGKYQYYTYCHHMSLKWMRHIDWMRMWSGKMHRSFKKYLRQMEQAMDIQRAAKSAPACGEKLVGRMIELLYIC